MDRRRFLFESLAVASSAVLPLRARAAGALSGRLATIETSTGGRLGVYAMHAGGAPIVAYRSDERFLMCSTFKFLAVAAVLSRVDAGQAHLDRRIAYGKADLLDYAPVTRKHVGEGSMTLGDLCQAAIDYSDNTAANLIVASIGGPSAVTRYARSIGDAFTRLDRYEPALNTALPGDVRDTTTPSATARDMRRILLGDALSAGSRARLQAWLEANTTGAARLRAGFPAAWVVADKTGTGGGHTASGDSDTGNDIALVRPPAREPFIVTVYLTGVRVAAAARDAAIASVARALTETLT